MASWAHPDRRRLCGSRCRWSVDAQDSQLAELLGAVEQGNVAGVEKLAARDGHHRLFEPRDDDASGETPLHIAAARGHAKLLRFLLRHPLCAHPDPRDWVDDATPLWRAAFAKHREATEVLLMAFADLDATPRRGAHAGISARDIIMQRRWPELLAQRAEHEAQRAARLKERAAARLERQQQRAKARSETRLSETMSMRRLR